jgi:hypothetical protein
MDEVSGVMLPGKRQQATASGTPRGSGIFFVRTNLTLVLSAPIAILMIVHPRRLPRFAKPQ